MRNDDAIMIRYIGDNHDRRFVIQRADAKFWLGVGWDEILDRAWVFPTHAAAQRACAALQYERHRGKPLRTFKIEMTVTLVADAVEAITQEALARYIFNAVRIDIDTSVYGDGPVSGSYVVGRLRLNTLKETRSKRKTF